MTSDTTTDGAAATASGTSDVVAADLHVAFVHALDTAVDWNAHHLKVSGMYWGMSALHLLDRLDYRKDDVVSFLRQCYNDDGGFGGNVGHDSHMLSTLSAVQLLCLFDALDDDNGTAAAADGGDARVIDVDKTARWVASMQRPDGSFQGDVWGEVDTRFVYIAFSCLRLLGRLSYVDVDAAVSWVLQCQNWDGGFGVTPCAESHAGQVFCCLGALCIARALHRLDATRTATWLAMRQLPSGGLNGRPEKKADVCYSWWVVASLAILDATAYIDRDALFRYIFLCQDVDEGGFADKPGNMPDVYHTFFALCGLSLLGYRGYALRDVNPVYALPYDVLARVGVTVADGLDVGRCHGHDGGDDDSGGHQHDTTTTAAHDA